LWRGWAFAGAAGGRDSVGNQAGLEITESVLLQKSEMTLATLQQVNDYRPHPMAAFRRQPRLSHARFIGYDVDQADAS
jgi:hypothetical protein